nr:MAG TPA: hypothetical protein [Caudoviricetes sp.]
MHIKFVSSVHRHKSCVRKILYIWIFRTTPLIYCEFFDMFLHKNIKYFNYLCYNFTKVC